MLCWSHMLRDLHELGKESFEEVIAASAIRLSIRGSSRMEILPGVIRVADVNMLDSSVSTIFYNHKGLVVEVYQHVRS